MNCQRCNENMDKMTVCHQICPNCGGNFTQRPIRPEALLKKYPISTKVVFKPVDIASHLKRIQSK